MTDIAIALLPALLVGTVQLSLGGLRATLRQKMLGLFTGGLLCALVSVALAHPHLTARTVAVGLLSGALVAWGLVDQTRAMRAVGVSRAIPISTGAQLATISLGGVVLLGQWRGPGALPVGLAAVAALVLGVWLTSRTEARTEGDGAGRQVDWRRGVVLLTTSTVGLSGYLLVVQAAGISGRDVILPQAVGWTLTGAVLTSRWLLGRTDDPAASAGRGPAVPAASAASAGRQQEGPQAAAAPGTPAAQAPARLLGRPFVQHLAVGVVWGAGTLLTQVASDRVGVATAFPLSQLCVLISTVGGIVLLGETRSRREMRWTVAGLVLILAGAVLVGIAKALDGGL